jgi:hypothetical protein
MVIVQILRADLILIDEIGLAPMNDTGAKAFSCVIAAAYEHRTFVLYSRCPLRSEIGSCPYTTPQPPGRIHPSRVRSSHEGRAISNEGGPNEGSSDFVKEQVILVRGVRVFGGHQQGLEISL